MTTPLRLFNTLTRQVEPIAPLDGKIVRMYACGPTVYNHAHIGNLRTFVSVDLLKRALRFLGYGVRHVMNVTDVDDKTIRGARAAGKDLRAFTTEYLEIFKQDLARLNISLPDELPRATDYMPAMQDLVRRLLAKNAAYASDDGSVYFRIAAFPEYGCLAHLDREGLQAGARVSQDEYQKESVGDFAVWKAWTPEDGEVAWDLRLDGGRVVKGRPGWHLECSAMSMDLLGEEFDLHCGGVDLIFPHHENEIAQSEAATGKRFARHWFHGEHLMVEGEKMSKSLGNLYRLSDIEAKGFHPLDLRMAFLHATHYRQNLNFSWETLKSERAARQRMAEWVRRFGAEGGQLAKDETLSSEFLARFGESLADDLNLPAAMGHLFDFIRETNRRMDAQQTVPDLQRVWNVVDGVLGLGDGDDFFQTEVPETVSNLLADRASARQAKDWRKSDDLRDAIAALGWQVKDTKHGQELKKL